jgi:hypothetical protein
MRDVFDRYIGAAPAPEFDLDALARRGRRIRRRRTAYAGGGVALAIGAGAVGLALLPPKPAVPPPPATVTSASPGIVTSASPSPPAAAEVDQLLAALRDAIAREAPGVTSLETLRRYAELCKPDTHGDTRVQYSPEVAPSTCPGRAGRVIDVSRNYLWQGRITAPSGVYAIRIFIYPATHFDPSAPPVNETDAEERRIAEEQGEAPRRGPNGESILAFSYLLNMTKPDGTGIMIQVEDTDQTGAYAIRSPFTADQLAAIGLDPRLHL